jgi:hypothetical protein
MQFAILTQKRRRFKGTVPPSSSSGSWGRHLQREILPDQAMK